MTKNTKMIKKITLIIRHNFMNQKILKSRKLKLKSKYSELIAEKPAHINFAK